MRQKNLIFDRDDFFEREKEGAAKLSSELEINSRT